jgi:hemerythrin-like domain-containing protein
MREHGVLKRVLLIYEDIVRRLIGEKPFDPRVLPSVLYSTASIVHHFIENYHQQLEEDYVFPLFLQAGEHVNMVHVLLNQHQAAKKITNQLLQYSSVIGEYNFQASYYVAHLLSLYIRMYEPHEAREDTELFPDLRRIVGKEEFEQMGEQFEEIEHEKFGENGFKRIVNQITELEKVLGIYDLAQFTPHFYEFR